MKLIQLFSWLTGLTIFSRQDNRIYWIKAETESAFLILTVWYFAIFFNQIYLIQSSC